MHRSRLTVAAGTLALLLTLASCAAPDPSESASPSASASRSAQATPTGSASASASPTEGESAPEPDPDAPEPLPSSDPATLDWFGLDQGAVTDQCRSALAEAFPGATIDDLPSRTQRVEETVASFEWIVRGWDGAPDFAAICQLGIDGGAISSVFVTVQDI